MKFYNLFPESCLACRRFLSSYTQVLLCELCLDQLCFSQKKTIEPFPTVSLIDYDNPVIKSVLNAVKFESNYRVATAFSKVILDKLTCLNISFSKDCIWVPMPIHRKRLKQRGYNQVNVLFEPVAQFFGIPFLPAIERIKHTDPLFGLSRSERREMVRDAYALNLNYSKSLYGKHVWLIDDIVTTGASFSEVSKLVQMAGAKSVLGFTLAKSELNDL